MQRNLAIDEKKNSEKIVVRKQKTDKCHLNYKGQSNEMSNFEKR